MRDASNPSAWWSTASAAVLLSACGPRTAQTVAAQPDIHVSSALAAQQVITVSLDNGPSTLDPLLTNEAPTQHVLDDLFEGLVAIGIDGRPVPGVARDWTVSADGKTWSFHLRPEARWSNGEPVTARDFIYAWQREVDPKAGAVFAQALDSLVNAKQITAGHLPSSALGLESPDAHTLILHLTEPVPYFLELLDQQYFYPLYEPAITQWGDQWVRPEHMVCNGAFRLHEDTRNTRVTLVRNDNYWDAHSVRLQKVSYVILQDSSIHSLRFQSGEVQFAYTFPSSQYQWLTAHFREQAVAAPYLGTMMLEFNLAAPPFQNNPALRRALSMSIDRTDLTRYFKQGLNESAFDLVPPLAGYAQAKPDWSDLPDSQRYAEARRLYAQAGYSKDRPLRLELSIPSQGPDNRRIFEAMVDMWYRHLGAEIAIDQRELKVLTQQERLNTLPLYQLAWIGDFPDPLTFLDLFRSQADDNFARYSSTAFDALMSRAEQELDPQQRYQLLSQAESILNQDSAMIPIFYYGSRHLIKPYVKGWQSNLIDRHPSRYLYILEHNGS